ncbi:hypothetical protein RC77_05330 [Pectobacterium brasiliense]|uniref:hypothetical protein n=1 Tax=Pectobacterium brasiliense TaxID=180957 RepID=UPI000580A165|nr:hypothetical protein [Pectobacterium brasiliense]KHS70936.1 hypothetical protein RC77_05330 [Pectobacterium brasiliense]
MINKDAEINSVTGSLVEPINKRQVFEREYDKAVEHSANYLGNDEHIEQSRDAFNRVSNIENEIASQTKLLNTLVDKY